MFARPYIIAMKNTITTAEAAARLGVTMRRVQAMIKKGLLPAQNIEGRVYLIDPADLAKFKPRKPGRPKRE